MTLWAKWHVCEGILNGSHGHGVQADTHDGVEHAETCRKKGSEPTQASKRTNSKQEQRAASKQYCVGTEHERFGKCHGPYGTMQKRTVKHWGSTGDPFRRSRCNQGGTPPSLLSPELVTKPIQVIDLLLPAKSRRSTTRQAGRCTCSTLSPGFGDFRSFCLSLTHSGDKTCDTMRPYQVQAAAWRTCPSYPDLGPGRGCTGPALKAQACLSPK